MLGDEYFRLQNEYEIITLGIYNWMNDNDLMSWYYEYVCMNVCNHFMRCGFARVKGTQKVNSLMKVKSYATKAMDYGREGEASQILSKVKTLD